MMFFADVFAVNWAGILLILALFLSIILLILCIVCFKHGIKNHRNPNTQIIGTILLVLVFPLGLFMLLGIMSGNNRY